MHYFSSMALTLNEPEDAVAPTDSRLRPDQRLMEAGLWDEANAQKQRLEEGQRLDRRKREAQTTLAVEEGKKGRSRGERKTDCVCWGGGGGGYAVTFRCISKLLRAGQVIFVFDVMLPCSGTAFSPTTLEVLELDRHRRRD